VNGSREGKDCARKIAKVVVKTVAHKGTTSRRVEEDKGSGIPKGAEGSLRDGRGVRVWTRAGVQGGGGKGVRWEGIGRAEAEKV